MKNPNKVERVGKQVIEGKLLAALEDKGTVACLFSKDDLDTLIASLTISERDRMSFGDAQREMRLSLEQLRREAFGE